MVKVFTFVCGLGGAFVLQGCGGGANGGQGGGGVSSTSSTTELVGPTSMTTSTTTPINATTTDATTTEATPTEATTTDATTTGSTTTTTFYPGGPWSGPCVSSGKTGDVLLDALNDLYLGFDEEDESSPNGVTIRMYDTFDMWCGGNCYDAALPDCRMSASLYNSKMMLVKGRIAVTMKRYAGIVFNQKAIETRLSKCSYMYDAATWGRRNRGCGCPSNYKNCGMKASPYDDQTCEWDPPDEHPGTGKGRAWNGFKEGSCHNQSITDPDVVDCLCDAKHPRFHTPKMTTDIQCAWKGPAIIYNSEFSKKPDYAESQLRDMVLQRKKDQLRMRGGEPHDKVEYWNEVIIDSEALRDTMYQDPNAMISAFMYVPGLNGRTLAMEMSKKAHTDYGGKRIPVVEFNPHVDPRCNGPFVNQVSEEEFDEVLV